MPRLGGQIDFMTLLYRFTFLVFVSVTFVNSENVFAEETQQHRKTFVNQSRNSVTSVEKLQSLDLKVAEQSKA
jgi:hypothetical protein